MFAPHTQAGCLRSIKMNIYYAIGGGLGHLTRARAFLRQMDIEKATAILTASKFAADKRVVGEIEIILLEKDLDKEKELFRFFLRRTLEKLNCEILYLDAFPFGILGELLEIELEGIEVNYVARLLKPDACPNADVSPSKKFATTFVVEELSAKHLEFINRNSLKTESLDLKYESLETGDQKLKIEIVRNHSPFWLIVHAGSASETNELIEYAKEIRGIEKANVELVLVSPNDFGFENTYDFYPACDLFPHAEKIFSACGSNIIKQTEKFREKHLFVPFERQFDDQFLRAKIVREILGQNSSGVHFSIP